ncbi:hypothetical protein [Burkholderia pyrrocinia]|uniref:hypothetical protein n=1 Tax=Burkholderia pyrrocinia TaxID=60550 RepID=UPI00158BB936|nr:hypothetical protein [Burkholderia pyrrocinia]
MNSPLRSSSLANAGTWKAWSLICVAEASRIGVAPLSTMHLHVLLYLANTLASLFDLSRIRGRILKRGAHPFFPDVQAEIDRMAFSGVLIIEHVDFGPKGHLSAHYNLGKDGARIYTQLIDQSLDSRRVSKLFRELVTACFGKFLGANGAIGPIDANYGNNSVIEGEVVDFSEWTDENNNLRVANYLIDKLKALRPDAERDGVRLYCEYLDKALAIA